ncbi:dTDP-4-dehydrorhamnose reductase [Cohnella boryungensis]|uniref:dTDP-4-dehydrorhamnose reductase n=1 Tax=Cohnella boryungensis TaxID=768479 RepID=A0ABV8S747_9BACL
MGTDAVKLLVTGANGQLGQELVHMGNARIQIAGFGRDQLDITDLNRCREVLAEVKPHGIIHTAAYTAVDKAESEPDEAYRVNAIGTRNLAVAAEEIGAKLVFVSTDYVFDGTGTTPYEESTETNPQSVYGKTKRAGEEFVLDLSSRYFIVRTSWVYGQYGSNFVRTMLKLATERDTITVVADQIGSPTYARDLAAFLIQLVHTEKYGIYHATNSGSCSWYTFAREIFSEKGMNVRVEPCTTAEFRRPAPRPAYSVLDRAAIPRNGLSDLRPWREALREFLGVKEP